MPSAPPAVEDLQAWLAAKRQVLIAALAQKLVEAWDATADFDFNDFGHAAADIVARARALLALPTPQPPADGEVAELVEWLQSMRDLAGEHNPDEQRRYTRAADLLERPTPQPVAEGPTDDELHDLWMNSMEPGEARNAFAFTRAAIAADRARRPTPQPPADGEVGELVETLKGIAYWRRHGTIGGPPPAPFDIRQADRLTRAAELLEHPTPQPVAVSERLPGAKDCALWPSDPEATPWCWAGKDIDGGWEWAQISMLGLGTDTLSRIIAGGGWTHWLPSSALPTPETTND